MDARQRDAQLAEQRILLLCHRTALGDVQDDLGVAGAALRERQRAHPVQLGAPDVLRLLLHQRLRLVELP